MLPSSTPRRQEVVARTPLNDARSRSLVARGPDNPLWGIGRSTRSTTWRRTSSCPFELPARVAPRALTPAAPRVDRSRPGTVTVRSVEVEEDGTVSFLDMRRVEGYCDGR